MGCTSGLANILCYECKEKEWIEQKKEYFCKRFNVTLTRVDGNSGGAVRNILCRSNKNLHSKKAR